MDDESGFISSPHSMNIEMSRNVIEDSNINIKDISLIKNCLVSDIDGNSKRIGDICEGKRTILIFVRHFLCYSSVEYVEDLAMINPKKLEEAEVQIVVIGCAPWRFIKSFVERTNYCHQIYCDPGREIHEILGLRSEKNMGSSKDSKHIKSSFLVGIMKSTWRAMLSQQWQGDPHQQGGSLVIDTDGSILLSHKDARSSDHCSINSLLTAAGLEPVSFPKDPQVQIV